jgi:hypothetical protein
VLHSGRAGLYLLSITERSKMLQTENPSLTRLNQAQAKMKKLAEDL